MYNTVQTFVHNLKQLEFTHDTGTDAVHNENSIVIQSKNWFNNTVTKVSRIKKVQSQ